MFLLPYDVTRRKASCTMRLGAEVRLLHVLEPAAVAASARAGTGMEASLVPSTSLEDFVAEQRQHARDQLSELKDRYESPDFHLTTELLEGKADREISNRVMDNTIDLVVIATQGHTRLHRFLFGSVAEKVIRSARCPVLTVSPENLND